MYCKLGWPETKRNLADPNKKGVMDYIELENLTIG